MPMPTSRKDTLFKPSSRAEDKWETTNTVSRSMTEAEHNARARKTERLRKLRLDAEQGSGDAKEKPRTKTRAKSR